MLIRFHAASYQLLSVCALLVVAAACVTGPADRQKLADAIAHEDVVRFTAELHKGFTPDADNASDGTGKITLIDRAADSDSTDFLRLLLDKGIKVDLRTADGDTPLILAAAFGKTNAVRYLLDRGARIDAGVDARSGTALMAAAKARHLDIVSLLVERGASVNQGHMFATPLFLAADAGHRDVVEYLIAKGATTDEMERKAVEEMHQDIAKLMLRADVVERSNARTNAIMAEVREITLQAAALVKRSQETGERLSRTSLAILRFPARKRGKFHFRVPFRFVCSSRTSTSARTAQRGTT